MEGVWGAVVWLARPTVWHFHGVDKSNLEWHVQAKHCGSHMKQPYEALTFNRALAFSFVCSNRCCNGHTIRELLSTLKQQSHANSMTALPQGVRSVSHQQVRQQVH